MDVSRRGFIGSSAMVLAGAAEVSGRSAFANVPEAPTTKSPLPRPARSEDRAGLPAGRPPRTAGRCLGA